MRILNSEPSPVIWRGQGEANLKNEYLRGEDYDADDDGHDDRKEDGAGGHVFCVASIRVKIRASEINIHFDGGIEGFGNKNHADGKNENRPFSRRNTQSKSEIDG